MKGHDMSERWALFRDGEQISKSHSTPWAIACEAYEMGAVVKWLPDFPGDSEGVSLLAGYEIRKVADERAG